MGTPSRFKNEITKWVFYSSNMKSTNQLIMSLGRDVCHVSFVLVYFFFFSGGCCGCF